MTTKTAAERLAIEVLGILSAFELELRDVIGNTNYKVLKDKALAISPADETEKQVLG